MLRFSLLSLCLVFALPSVTSAQRRVQYDTIAMGVPTTVSCGVCAGEKFGVVFRELSGGGGLLESSFPLTVESLEIALASVRVESGLFCVGSSAGGAVDTIVELYAGTTAPTGAILAMPESGPWTDFGEVLVWSDTVPITRSVATTDGGMSFNLMFNRVDLPAGTRVEMAGMTYLRAVVTIPASGAIDGYCHLLDASYQEPAGAPVRDSGRTENELNFIYAIETRNPLTGVVELAEGWYWNESSAITDPATGGSGIGGDWGLRLNVIPSGGSTDAGPPGSDAGVPPGTDAGVTPGTDAGVPPGTDAGVPPGTDAGDTPGMDGGAGPMCTVDVDCMGGERCVSGTCRRLACTTATDCTGGMTCYEGMCRNLCSSNAECLGGEVCDTGLGHCVPVDSMSGGCGCRAGSSSTPMSAGLLGLLVLGALGLRRRRR